MIETFTVGQWNWGDTGRNVTLDTLAEKGTIICLNEVSDRTPDIAAFLRTHPNWRQFYADLDGGPATRILIDTERHGAPAAVISHPGVEARFVGKGKFRNGKWTAAGPRRSKAKPIIEVALANGVHIFALHMIASATKTEAQLGTRTYEARRDHYEDMVVALFDAVDLVPAGEPVVVAGDLNAEPSFELLEPLQQYLSAGHGFVNWTGEGTFGAQRIDHILYLPGRDLEVTDTRVTDSTSDHRKLEADFELTTTEEQPVPTITQKVVRNLQGRGVDILTRADWGSRNEETYKWRRKNRKHSLLPEHPVDTVWQHITVTNDSGDLTGDFKTDIRTVERIGMERFGTGISYNWVVDMRTGMVGVGQPLDARGAHTLNDKNAKTPSGGFLSYNQNKVSVAIAVLGMCDDRLSEAAEAAIVQVLAAMIEEDAVTTGFDYLPHSLVAAKECPCDSTRDKMGEIRRLALAAVDQ